MNSHQPLHKPAAASDAEMLTDLLVAAAERAELDPVPCDHIYMSQVFDPATYAALQAALPAREKFHFLMHRDALRPDGTSTRLRIYLFPEMLGRLPADERATWSAMSKALRSPRLQQAFKAKFRASLERRFNKPVEQLSLVPVPILLRDQPGYRIGIHSDTGKKAITVQYYLPVDDSQVGIGTRFHAARDGAGADDITQMKFLPSSGYAFPVSLTESWHSAATVREEDGERVSMMVTYYVTESLFRKAFWMVRRALMRFGINPER